MNGSHIILRRDIKRARQRVYYHVRKGKVRAELEEEARIDRIVDSLWGKIDFEGKKGEQSRAEMREVLEAILSEFKLLTEDAIYRYYKQVLVAGCLRVFQERGEVEVRKDSYGRTMYRMKQR